MNDLEHDFKEKPKHRTRQMPLDFVIPLQLEECIYRIEYHAPKKSLKVTPIPSQGENPDEPEVRVIFHKTGTTVMKAQGKLRRWEGTSTRFEGSFTSSAMDGGVVILLGLITTFYPIPACMLTIMFTRSQLDNGEMAMLLIGLWLVLYIVIFVLLDCWSDRVNHRDLIEAIHSYLMNEINR